MIRGFSLAVRVGDSLVIGAGTYYVMRDERQVRAYMLGISLPGCLGGR